MYRFFEKSFFSIFFIFIFLKFAVSLYINSALVTYIYYGILITFIVIELLKNKNLKLNLTELALVGSIFWCVAIALINAEPNEFFYKKLNSFVITFLTFPIAYYIFYRGLLSALMIVSSVALFFIAILFFIFGTYDEENIAYLLNNFYLHGAFLCGFIILLSFVFKKHYGLVPPLLIAIILFGSRGPLVAFLITVIFISIFYVAKFFLSPKIKKKYLKHFVISLPIFIGAAFLFLPNLFSRMISRFDVFFSETGGGDSIQRRLEHIEASKQIFTNDPLLGIGFGNYGKYFDGFHSSSYPHNLFLELFVESGIIGATPFIACIGFILIKGIVNKGWPILFFVLVAMQFSYSYVELNELYFASVLVILISKTDRNYLKEII